MKIMIEIDKVKDLIVKGYNIFCDEIQELILYRINNSGSDILDYFVNNHREYVDEFCIKHKLDLVTVIQSNNDIKERLGYRIIESSIMAQLKDKQGYDEEIKKLNISTIKFTNGIENSPWLKLFGSPNNLRWFNRRTNELIEQLNPNDNDWHKYIVDTIKDISTTEWIDPQDVKPNISDYHHLMDFHVPEKAKDIIVKLSGQ